VPLYAVGVSLRALLSVLALTLADYLLWHWSLAGNHDVLALASGLTLPPLAVAGAWLLALSLARLLARGARAPAERLRVHGTRAVQSIAAAPRGGSARSAVVEPRVVRAAHVARGAHQQAATPPARTATEEAARKLAA